MTARCPMDWVNTPKQVAYAFCGSCGHVVKSTKGCPMTRGEVTAMGRGVRDDQSRTHGLTSRAPGESFGLTAGEHLPNVQMGGA